MCQQVGEGGLCQQVQHSEAPCQVGGGQSQYPGVGCGAWANTPLGILHTLQPPPHHCSDYSPHTTHLITSHYSPTI